ncbi:hypothetical protein ID866_10716 [Astraeus odoratus]|nr:hypothetical protein ID866_10716 [Astraeus odoratus]
MAARTAERGQKCKEEEQRIHAEAERREQEVTEQKRKEEEEAQRAEEAKKEADWLKAAGGAMQNRRRMEAKENDDEDDEEDDEDNGEGDFVVPPALVQEHRDTLSTLMTTLSALLKEFKGYCHEQWDLQACQVRGLKALQREMKKANALKVKELEATTKGKEKVAEVPEESLESGNEGEQIEGEGGEGGEAIEVCHLSTNVILSRVWPPRRANKEENGVQQNKEWRKN